MNEERKQLFRKVNELIDKKKNELLKSLPNIHEIEDGIIIRSFYGWNNCEENHEIKYKKIPNINKPEESVYFYYFPKGSVLETKERKHINCITCLTGNIEINVNNEIHNLKAYNKILLGHNNFGCKILENTYIITTNLE